MSLYEDNLGVKANLRRVTCTVGSGLHMTVVIGSVAQALDVVGDLLSKQFPVI